MRGNSIPIPSHFRLLILIPVDFPSQIPVSSRGAPSSATYGQRTQRSLSTHSSVACLSFQSTYGQSQLVRYTRWDKKGIRRSWSLIKLHNGGFSDGTIICRKNMQVSTRTWITVRILWRHMDIVSPGLWLLFWIRHHTRRARWTSASFTFTCSASLL